MPTIESLNKQFTETDGVHFCLAKDLYPKQGGDIPFLVVENRLAKAAIALQGAHITSFKPRGKSDVLWISPKSNFEAGKPIRGGIPLCLPWFSAHPSGQDFPMHGFARITEWTVASISGLPDGGTLVSLTLADSKETLVSWPHAFQFRLNITIGKKLTLGLTVENKSAEPAKLTFAWHTYFNVGDVAAIRVEGLEDCPYIDKLDKMAKKTQDGALVFRAATDSVYSDVPTVQTIHSPVGTWRIEGSGKNAIAWNAWTNDANIADIGEGNHKGYVCIERGDVLDHAVTIRAKGNYHNNMIISAI